MQKEVAVIEIKDKHFRLIIGYLYDEKIDILYEKRYVLTNENNDGDIFDVNSLANDLKVITSISDQKQRLKINITEVVLVLPSFGLEVYNTQKSTNTISNDGRIDKIDIANALSLVKKEKIPNQNNVITDIIPNVFITDDSRNFSEPPLGEISTNILIDANVYTLPNNLVSKLKEAITNAGLKIKRTVISPIGVDCLLKAKKFKFDTYILVEYDQTNTVLSFIGKHTLFQSNFFKIGGEHITYDIATHFSIPFEKAEEIKQTYGLDLRDTLFNTPILEVLGPDGFKRKYTKDDLNSVITNSFKSWQGYFSNSLNTLLKDYEELIEKIPLVFIGDSSLVNGFKNFLHKNYPNNPVEFINYNAVGAEKPSNINCLGAIQYVSVYQGTLEEEVKVKIADIQRTNEEKYREDEDLL